MRALGAHVLLSLFLVARLVLCRPLEFSPEGPELGRARTCSKKNVRKRFKSAQKGLRGVQNCSKLLKTAQKVGKCKRVARKCMF